MQRTNHPCCQRSMKVRSSGRGSHGWSSFSKCTAFFYGLLLCIFVPDSTQAAYTPPSNCTSVTWVYGGSKVQNISCAGQQLISVPKDGKEGSDVFKLDLSNNQISSLAIDEFQYFSNLQYLDVSYNQIPSVNSDTFTNLTSLKTLNLAANDLKYLPSGTFTATSALTTFNLSRNVNLTFGKRKSTSLLVLDLSYTNITSLTKKHFESLVNLEEVNLSHNNLTDLERDLFQDHSSLRIINLSWNELTTLSNHHHFKSCTSLAVLDLSHNSIVDVHKDFLKDADPMTNLDLSHNQIASLDTSVFEDVRSVETIYLNNNLLTSLPEDLFRDLSALNTLDLSYNQLTTLPSRIFEDPVALTTLHLNNNELGSLAANLFRDNPSLQYIFLNNNLLDTIPLSLFQYQTTGTLKVDISGNQFICDCDVRDYLYTLLYDSSKVIENSDSTACTDTTLNTHVYLDYNDLTCSGNLGSACTVTSECMVQNAKCDISQCVCSDNYYDTNGDTTDGGLCRDKVALDYPCPAMDSACSGDNVICTVKSPSASDTYCLCKPLYYDDNPQYLDGTCRLKVELGEACVSANNMCRPDNSICGTTSSQCECLTDYYDDNYLSLGGECLNKIPLHGSCNASYQCQPSNSECSNNTCECASGYYDFTNLGQCQDPSSYFSCSPDNKSSLHIVFSIVKVVSNEADCSQHCFEQDQRYYHMEGSVLCICGSPSSDYRCCPMVTSTCNAKIYLGPSTLLAEAGINVTHVVRPTAGQSHSFPVTTTLPAIDQVKAKFGDSMTVTTVNAPVATFQHTYTHSGLFWLTISACAANFSVCEDVSIPVKVQVPPENVTTYLRGVADTEVSSALSNSFSATFKLGYDIDFFWSRTFNSIVTKKKACSSDWTTHRQSCLKLESLPATFSAAQTACSASGKLLKIDFEVELAEIITELSASSGTYFVGAQRVGGVWQWLDGSKTFFSDDDLTVSTNGDCLILDGSSGQLTTATCTSTTKYICMSDPESCPLGGELVNDGYCYVLASTESITPKTQTDANTYCMSNFGGWLANITDSTTQSTVTNLLTTAGVSDAWIGLRQLKGVYLWGDNSVYDFYNPPYMPTVSSGTGDCFVTMASGSWNSQDCSNIKDFVCQYSESIQRKSVPSYILGNPDINIAPGNNLNLNIPTGGFSATGTEILLFPGLAFSRSGNIQEWIFCSIDAISGSYDIAFLIWRPTCSVGSKIQAGCIPTMFASCSTGTHSCTPTTSCSDTEKFCYLSNTCKFMNESCTCNSVTSAGCGTVGTVPTYELVGQTMATITNTGERCYKVPDGDTAIQEDDVIGLQFPTGNNIVKCEDNPTNSEQQTLYSATSSIWLVKPNTFPTSYSTVDRTCNLQVVYTQESEEYLPESLGYTSSVGSYQFAVTLIETETKQLSVSVEETIADLDWVYPKLSIASASATSFGTVYTEHNQVYHFTAAAGRGTNLMAKFSFEPTQLLSFTNSCVPEVATAVADACNSTLYWSNKPFTSFSFNTSTVGTTNLTVDIINALGSESRYLTIRTEERISGVTFNLVTPSLIANTVAVNTYAQFDLGIVKGTGLSYSFTVGGSPTHSTNSSLLYQFITTGTFIVEGTVENILSTETKTITVDAKIAAKFANCQFLETPYTAAVGLSFNLKLQCDVSIGSEISADWMFSDGTSNITGTVSTANSSPFLWTQPVTLGSVSTVNITAFAHDPFEAVSIVGTVNVYNQVPSVTLVSNSTDVFHDVTVGFTASIPSSPGNYGTVIYLFDYGDGDSDNSSTGVVTHSYSVGGNYTVRVTASNGPSDRTDTVYVTVYEQVTDLKLTYNGPKEKSNPVTFTVSVSSGNFLSYTFVSSPPAISVTQSSPVFSQTFATADDYNVTVTAANTLSQQSESIVAYVMNAADISISELLVDGNVVSGCIETKIGRNFTANVIHYSLPNVVCTWNFGDGTTSVDTSCSKAHAYSKADNFTVQVTAKYKPQGAEIQVTSELCLQERISSPTISITSPVALPSSGQITKNVNVSVATGDPLLYSWSTNATGGQATSAVFLVEFTSEGKYSISVNISNQINFMQVTETVVVIEEISGMDINCASCIEINGAFHVRDNVANTFTITMTTGTSVTYSWDFGDGTTGSGDSNSHTYTTIGTYNLTITGTSAVTPARTKFVTIHVETAILSVSVKNYQWDWLNDIVDPTAWNLNIEKVGKFKADVSPTGMDLDYIWTFETGLAEQITNSNIGEHLYDTIGHKSLSLTVRNSLGNVTSAPFEFYVIKPFNRSYIEVTEDGNSLLGTTESNTYKVALNKISTFSISSLEIVPNTVEYFLRLKIKNGGSWALKFATNNKSDNSLEFDFTEESVYSLEASIENSLGNVLVTVYIEALQAVSDPYINASPGADGNITFGSSIQLTGGATVGQYLTYNWFYAVAPSGQTLSNNVATVNIMPGAVGHYIVTLQVSNPVSSPVSVNYTISVMMGVSGVTIDVTMTYQDAVKVGSSLSFNGAVTAGTDLSYSWNVTQAGSLESSGNAQSFTYLFNTQALYKVTLVIENFASSGTATKDIYCLDDVPSFNIQGNGVTYLSNVNKHVARTNDIITFSSDISNTDFIDFNWKIDGSSETTNETLQKTFTSPAEYGVQLNASNRVSSETQALSVLFQDAIAGFSIHNCYGTYQMNTIITLTASYTSGTNITVLWNPEQFADSTSTATAVNYGAVGNYSVNVTGSNYVSQEIKFCWITIQGEVKNLNVGVSQHKFVNYTVAFNVTGDYVSPAKIVWVFSHGVTRTTNTPTLDLTFAAKGTYTLEVTVSNDVSSSTANITFQVVELACRTPTVQFVGNTNRQVRRARTVEFSVDISTGGCTHYSSINSWKIYTDSCAAASASELTLASSVQTNTPMLQLKSNTIDYGTYCVVFKHSYDNTPVEQYKFINLTIVESALTPVLSGGHKRGASEGTTLTVNASESYDPDRVSGTLLQYTWTCTQTVGSSTGLCAQINSLTTSWATLTGLTLSVGEVYNIQVTVSANRRTSGTTSQQITIQSSTTPEVSIKCVSCDAYGHFYLTSSRSVAFMGWCVSNCNGSASYHWTVIDSVTNTPLTIDSSQTSTGTDQQTFVLKHSNLQSGRAYSFKLEVTIGSETGSAELSLNPSSKPSAGNCSVTPSSNFIPMSHKLKFSCSNVVDSDTYSTIYYKVMVKSTTVYWEPIIAYYGPKAENEIYLVPFPGTNYDSIDVEIRAVNDYGAENDGYQRTISFTAETLTSSQASKVDYLVDQMISIMSTVVKLNNPATLRQFLLTALGYLNDLSMNDIGTPAERTAIRDMIVKAISGLPMFSVYDIQQTASALSYLVSYTEEISLDTINQALNEIDAIKQEWESEGILQGADQRDYDSGTAMAVIGTIHQALIAPSVVTSDSAVLNKFGDLNDYVLEVSSQTQTSTSLSTKQQIQSMIVQSMLFNTELMLIPLKATLPNEEALQKSTADYEYIAQHVSTNRINEEHDSRFGVQLGIASDVLSHSSYSQDSVFQLIYVSKGVQYDFGYSELEVSTVTLSTSFHDTGGSSIPINNLPAGKELIMYLFSKDVSVPYTINKTGIQHSTGYNPLTNMNYSSATLEPDREWAIDLNMPSGSDVGVHVQMRVNFTNTAASMKASLYKDNEIYGVQKPGINKDMMEELTHDHVDYTFFIDPTEYGNDDAFQLRLEVTETAEVFVGLYYSKCEYFQESSSQWDSSGCTPQEESIATVIKCSCNHMTSFGGSLFVSPDQLDFTDLSIIDFASNPVAIITCSVIVALYIILLIAFRRMDLMDLKRISLIPLCGKDGSFKYEITVVTGRLPGAGTTAHVGIRLHGEYGKSSRQHVIKGGAFQRNCSDTFIIAYDVNLGDLRKIQIWHDNSGLSPSWYLSHVIVNDLQTDNKYYFLGNTWLSLQQENGSIQKELKVAGAHEMSKFGHRFSTAVFNSLADKHIWLSLFNRPAQSRFTSIQRLTCCVTILFTFVMVNAMWYGLLKKENSELGFEDFGWEEIVLAMVSNIMVLPVSIGLVFLFKKSRSKPNFLEHAQKPQTAQTLEIENLCENSQGGSFESSNTGAIPYDLERESTFDSVPPTAALGLHRSRHVTKTHRENTDESIIQKRPSVAVTAASSKSPLWNEDGIMQWPESVPTYEGLDSRPSTGSTMASMPAVRQPPKAGGSIPTGARKSKTLQKGDAGELLAELDKLEHDLKESESRSVKSSGSKKSISLRKPTMHKSQWGSLEDILQSDDESVAESSGKMRKRGSTTSQSTTKKFNPREDPRINGNGKMWPKSRESIMSGTSAGSRGPASRGVTAGLRPGYYSEMTMESRDIKFHPAKESCSLPPWCIYIAYVICFLLCVFSTIIVILYCFKFGSQESLKWVLALILSLILSFLIIEPLKALLIAVYVVAMFKNVEQDEDDDFIDIEPTFDNSNEKIKDVKFKPISGFALLQAKEEGRKIHRMNVMIRQFIAYLFYLWLIMVIVYVHFHYNSYLMTKHVENDFIAPTTSGHLNFTNITSIDEFWDWTENVFVESLYKEKLTQYEEHALLLGEARMRLIRGNTAKCQAANAASSLGASSLTDRTCHGAGNYDEDTDNYAEGWNHSYSNFSWRHYTAGELGSTHKVGHVATYGGGGYPQGLGTSAAESDSILSHLKDKGWIDLQTRAIIFEFTLYSAGSDMTSLVALLAEFPLTGGLITSYEIQSQKLLWFQERTVDPLMVLECILFLVVAYSVVHIALEIREQRKSFFKDIWNWYEMLTTLMAVVSIGMYLGCVIEATNAFNRFLDNQTGFTNFERAVYVHVGMRYLHAWLLFLLMFKVVKQLRFIKFMYVYEKTLSQAVGYLIGTGLIYIILLMVYAQVGYLMYGSIVSGFESVGHAIPTLIVMIQGTFDFWPMLDHHPIFSHFYVYSYYSFAYGIMIALVISILTSTYKVVKSQMYYKSTLEMQDYEMIDFMLKRFKLWAGIQKQKPAFRRVRFPGLPSVSSRSSSSYSNRSSASLHSAESVTGPQYSEVQLRSMMARMAPTWQAVLRRMDKIVALDDEEENLVKKAENEMKKLNWNCRINELERQHKDILSWKNKPSTSGKPPAGDTKQRQSILKRSGAAKDNQDRKAPATVSGALNRTAASTPETNTDSRGRRPLSDQGVRVEQASTSKRRSSSTEKSKLQTFFKSIKPSKPAWNK